MRPVKQVLQTYASKWMFTYTKYLSDQVMYTSDVNGRISVTADCGVDLLQVCL
jgi:hypothetical protein